MRSRFLAAGRKFGREGSAMAETDGVYAGLLRLPVWVGLKPEELGFVVEAVQQLFGSA